MVYDFYHGVSMPNETNVTSQTAHKLVHESNIKTRKGTVYLFYACGHIFKLHNDPNVTKHLLSSDGKRGVRRICPYCWQEYKERRPLLTKYKRCLNCGAEHFGKCVQKSKRCSECAEKSATGRLDLDRTKCIHRKKCLTVYDAYKVLPCKGCTDFEPSEYYIY